MAFLNKNPFNNGYKVFISGNQHEEKKVSVVHQFIYWKTEKKSVKGYYYLGYYVETICSLTRRIGKISYFRCF